MDIEESCLDVDLPVLKRVGVLLNCHAPATNFSIDMNYSISCEVIDTVLGLPGFGVFVKFHPRSDMSFVDYIVDRYKGNPCFKNIEIPALVLAGLCNVGVMVGDSSVCLDFLARGVPVVMFAHDTVPVFRCEYVDMGFVDSASDVDVLRDLIVKYSSNKLRGKANE